jgi:hypothetical protein
MAQLSCCVRFEISARQITAEVVCKYAVVLIRFARCGDVRLDFRHNCRYTLSWGSSEWGAQDGCMRRVLAGPPNRLGWYGCAKICTHSPASTRDANFIEAYVPENVRWPKGFLTRGCEKGSGSGELYSATTVQASRCERYSTMPVNSCEEPRPIVNCTRLHLPKTGFAT